MPVSQPLSNVLTITKSQLPSFSAAAAPAGTIIRISDMKYAEFYSDGTNWRPRGGKQVVYLRSSSLATPMATMTGNGSAQVFTLPDTLVLPPGLLPPTNASVFVEAWTRRLAANGAFTAAIRFGTTNTVIDSGFNGITVTSAVNQDVWHFARAKMTSATSYVSTGFAGPNSQATSSQADTSANVNVASNMYLTIGGSPPASDVYAINYYCVTIEG